MDAQTKVTGVILAGGLARRMSGQDKGLVDFKGKPLINYAIAAISEIADVTIINANRNIKQYQEYGFPVISDLTGNFDGPLAGILAAMAYAKNGILLIMPCDMPFVKAQHIKKLLNALVENDADVAVACDSNRLYPVFLAINTALLPSLQAYLGSGYRKVETWLVQQKLVRVDFNGEAEIFININSMTELMVMRED
ncbi:MAG: molybdenum cofactor guanylyltransferase [Gammaproteobacteria bacterium]|nr:molybdenum cofactor guanylyltransferase [Gammaproteobacteria bacterium]